MNTLPSPRPALHAPQQPAQKPWRLLALLCLLCSGFAAAGYELYLWQVRNIQTEQAANLAAVAQLKTSQLMAWRQERLADARMNASGMVRYLALQWLQTGRAETLADVRQRLQFFLQNEGYLNMILADDNGRIRLSLLPRVTQLEQEEHELLQQVVASKKAVLGDFFYCRNCRRIHINAAAPVFDGDRVALVLLLVADPQRDLYPMIQSWPIAHSNAESLLVRRDGQNAILLNQPRHRSVSGLAFRIPLANTSSPAVQAVLGATGMVRGVDYRDVEVLANVNPVPESNWFMITKLDFPEIAASARYRAGGITLLVALATVVAGALVQLASLARRKTLNEALLHEEQGHRQTREEIRATLYGIGEGVIAADADGRITRMNPVAESLTGWLENEALGQPLSAVYRVINEDSEAIVESPVDQVLRRGEIVQMSNHTLLVAKDNSRRPIADSGAPIRNEAGVITGVVLVVRDQSKRRAMEKSRAESARRYTDLVENISDFIWETGANHRFTYASPRSRDMLGYDPGEFVGLALTELLAENNPAEVMQICADTLAGLRPFSQLCLSFARKDGAEVILESSAVPVFDPSGGFCGYRGVSRDITERKRTEDAQKRLESQLLQSQKMEVVGRLAGGVAHDFNNMLTVISSYVEMTLNELEERHPLYKRLYEVHKAARHSAELTGQLLAFARKQAIAPRVLDLNETISGSLKMLHRLIGENIELQWNPGPDLWQVRMDAAQIGQVLANLAVNARDAIDGIGRLTMHTGNVAVDPETCAACPELSPGDYVQLSITDNGCGMDRQTQEKIFEPFFTTKDEGQGTGLGLSTVYGIIKQNNGVIAVASAPSQGTTFRIFLPRVNFGSKAMPTATGNQTHRGKETVLLVEDETAILDMCAFLLEQHGYTVLVAQNPAQALDIVHRRQGTIDLLLTDVIMPDMNGRELSRRVLELLPAVKVLFMSGYTADIISRHGGDMDTGLHFLEKPFSASQLARKVREVIDRG
jgi:PAS domain S-box-containing protein